MKKILMLLVVLISSLALLGCDDTPKKDNIYKLDETSSHIYLHGSYYGECIYENPTLSSSMEGKEFNFNNGTYNGIWGEVIFNFHIFFDNFFEKTSPEELPIDKLKTASKINYYGLNSYNDRLQGLFVFKVANELYLFEVDYSKNDYTIWRGYKLVPNISTKANFTFFPSSPSDLHSEELKKAYDAYLIEHKSDLSSWGDYEISNLTSQEIFNKYNLDIFKVRYEKSSFYFVKHNDVVYEISPFDLNNENSNCISHMAITDINNDGHIEILTAINSFANRTSGYYCTSFIKVIDTKSQQSIEINDYKNVNYFKENEEGVISIYNADGVMPVSDDLHNEILDQKYYDLATNLFDTPVLNTSDYEFQKETLKVSCDLFEAEVTISDDFIKFPYLFKSTYTEPAFTINVKMKYLGETFMYTSPDGYLDGATVSFVNESDTITCEGWAATCVITKFIIMNGMEIESEYSYHESLKKVNKTGVYDMVITYENEETNLKESIIIEGFLELTRY